jgi:two-component system, chemotaxis family, chemotaxis protein CheY
MSHEKAHAKTVLIVDDAVFMRRMIRDILANSGRFTPLAEAANGREAVAKYDELRPDIVTMDLIMPELGGIAATREILARDPGALIVMCSTMGQDTMVMESITAGARDFIVKPFTPERVLKVLDGLPLTRS